VHHTRRFALADLQLAGAAVPRGACVLLLLVAEPALGYGHGRHQCPGQDLALQIASIALRHAPARPPELAAACLPLPNVRIPELPL
jgi:cytochrome P450